MPANKDAEKTNPCLKEQDLSYSCLNKNNFNREKCEVFFANYNNCKEFWNKVRATRRSQGIHPHLPDIGDREQIKAEYMQSKPQRPS